MKKFITITTLWGLWGFSLGTFILLGPVRKTVDYARTHDWSKTQESAVVFFFIALLIIVSFAIAYASSKVIQANGNKGRKGALIAVPIIATIISIALFLNPDIINAKDQESTISAGFTIGTYPTKEKLQQLKDEGYTIVLSLLHPAVVPFEPKLLDEEIENAAQVGIQLVSIPLLPWITDNEEAIDSLRRLIRSTKGKYYIHCYLGKDRVNVAKLVIQQESKLNIVGANLNQPRSLDSIAEFERGKIHKLVGNTYLIPMPTKEEYFGYIIAAGYKNIIAFKDFRDVGAAESIKEERLWLDPYKIPLKVFNVPNDISEARMKLIVDSVKSLEAPRVVHSFRSDGADSELFMRLYNAK